MDDLMRQVEHQGDPFVQYVNQFPDLAQRVQADLVRVEGAIHLLGLGRWVSCEQGMAACQALIRLWDVADAAGFAEVEAFFRGVYMRVCGELPQVEVTG